MKAWQAGDSFNPSKELTAVLTLSNVPTPEVVPPRFNPSKELTAVLTGGLPPKKVIVVMVSIPLRS